MVKRVCGCMPTQYLGFIGSPVVVYLYRGLMDDKIECTACEGTGVIVPPWEFSSLARECLRCAGTGEVVRSSQVVP